MDEPEKIKLPKQGHMIKSEDFEQIDIGIDECKTAGNIWGNKTDIFISVWGDFTGYEYGHQTIAAYADQSNRCLDWIEGHKKYIQKVIAENNIFQTEYSFKAIEEGRLCLNKIHMEISVQDGIQEILATLRINVKPFLFSGHCHCIEVLILEEEGTYHAEVINDMQRLLLEIRDAVKEKNEEVSEWAKNNGIFYALDDEGNMLAVVKQQFRLSKDNTLISETDGDFNRFSENRQERSALYFIWAKWKTEEQGVSEWTGLPMPLGFTAKELNCEKNVFTITSSSGHRAVTGTFFVMMEALTMMEMIYCTRGVTEEEIEQCYYRFLVEDHQKYLNRNL